MITFTIEGEDMRRSAVSKHGGGGMVYAPKAWVNREVVIILLPKREEKKR
ncbi:MAG: DUF2080 family transposase-associated protein [Candidatus Thermoplasmatota archaeon]